MGALTVVLGAPDAEAMAIESVAVAEGLWVAYAAMPATGMRVNPAEAMQEGEERVLLFPNGRIQRYNPDYLRVVAVECYGPWNRVRDTVVIDHHHPAIPQTNWGPELAFPASSLGQFLCFMEQRGCLSPMPVWSVKDTIEVTSLTGVDNDLPEGTIVFHQDCWWIRWLGLPENSLFWSPVDPLLVAIGAIDHNVGAAVAGNCRGVSAELAQRVRVEQWALTHG